MDRLALPPWNPSGLIRLVETNNPELNGLPDAIMGAMSSIFARSRALSAPRRAMAWSVEVPTELRSPRLRTRNAMAMKVITASMMSVMTRAMPRWPTRPGAPETGRCWWPARPGTPRSAQPAWRIFKGLFKTTFMDMHSDQDYGPGYAGERYEPGRRGSRGTVEPPQECRWTGTF